MAFTYEIGTDRGQVRLLIGDNRAERILLQDDEVDFFLAEEGSIYPAAAAAAEALAGKFAGDVAISRASGSLSKDQRFEHYTKLARTLRLKGFGKAESFAGGRKISEKDRQQDDPDRVQSRFRRDQDTIDGQSADDFIDDC